MRDIRRCDEPERASRVIRNWGSPRQVTAARLFFDSIFEAPDQTVLAQGRWVAAERVKFEGLVDFEIGVPSKTK